MQAAPTCSEGLEAALSRGTRRLQGSLRTEISCPLRSLLCLWPQVPVPTQPQMCSRWGLPSRSGAAGVWQCPSLCLSVPLSVRPSLLGRGQALPPTPSFSPSSCSVPADLQPSCPASSLSALINSCAVWRQGLILFLVRGVCSFVSPEDRMALMKHGGRTGAYSAPSCGPEYA